VENGAAWTSHVVRDGNLITGQNPQSSEDVAKEVLKALAE
jgi:putative intracellular protease/amidase